MIRYLIPAGVFAIIVVFLAIGLNLDPRKIPSPLVGKPVPAFALSRLKDPSASLDQNEFAGKVSLLNVWATWCVSCRAEHQILLALANSEKVDIYGLNYKDKREDAMRWLEVLGDPYVANAFDGDGRVGIDWGVYGTPETFLIDKQGVIRHKVIGPITVEILKEELLPLIEELKTTS
ncbi:MAG: DsbE family thiol:disulfide interchange protein [Gammaproteobacteria bacterium]|nr:DsbE family thiol:disulfide interchange protein [Gammaproteobacteria bacterium]